MPNYLLDAAAGHFRRLSHVQRFSNVPTVGDKDMVSSHSWYVSFYSFCLASHLISEGFDVDLGATLAGAVLHDTEEALVGDLLHPTRNGSQDMKDAVNSLMAVARVKLADSLPNSVSGAYLEAANNAKNSSIEGRLVAIADYLSVWAFSREQIEQGNSRNYEEILENAVHLVESVLQDIKTFDSAIYDSLVAFMYDTPSDWFADRREGSDTALLGQRDDFLNTHD